MSHMEERRGFIEVRLSLLSSVEGGRGRSVTSGYVPNWWLLGTPERVLASATIELVDADELVPGSTASTRVYPFAPELWDGVTLGTSLDVTEGPQRTIDRAVVTRVVPAAIPVGQSS